VTVTADTHPFGLPLDFFGLCRVWGTHDDDDPSDLFPRFHREEQTKKKRNTGVKQLKA
jgi:hypothetical protein